ncbi:DUF5385 family protein [Malacoplasma muris]|uniref:DUF5385 family protein n=1 Tax=Malacoplasma muris TaxID=2119 RepID=UPI00398E8A65
MEKLDFTKIINMGDMGGGSNNLLFLIILIFIPAIAIFYFYKKKKDKDNQPTQTKSEKQGEVWKTVKDFLKSKNESGKEIVETYVVKRPDENIVNKSLPKEKQKEQKEAIKKRNQALKEENKRLKAEGKLPKQIKQKELYVVLFTTRNPKTKKEDKPRVIECEVKMIKKNKYDTERVIVINGEKDYKTEAEWILPIKEAEEAKMKAAIKKEKKREEKRKEKTSKKVEKQKKKEEAKNKK